jgi:hypothetical protein
VWFDILYEPEPGRKHVVVWGGPARDASPKTALFRGCAHSESEIWIWPFFDPQAHHMTFLYVLVMYGSMDIHFWTFLEVVYFLKKRVRMHQNKDQLFTTPDTTKHCDMFIKCV